MLKRFAATVLACLALVAPARAEPIDIALFDIPPYASTGPHDEPTGIYVDLVRRIALQAGLEPHIRLLPFARVAASLRSGESMLSIGFATDALEQAAQPLGTVFTVDLVVLSNRSRPAQRVADLAGFRIGRARGGCQDLAALTPAPYSFHELIGFDSGLRMLELHRLDALCGTREVLQYHQALTGLGPERFAPLLVLSQRPVLLFLARGAPPALAARLRAALQVVQSQQTDSERARRR